MINEIIKKYENFSDALILEFIYRNSIASLNKGTIEITLRCMNSSRDYNWEIIMLKFMNVLNFRFIENEKTSSVVINSALLKMENGIMIFDFFPLMFENSILKENSNSDLLIKCMDIEYKLIEEL